MTPEPHDPLLLDHDYDGIGELDNKLPGWWLWLFYLSIGFSVVYLAYFDVLRLGKGSVDQYYGRVASLIQPVAGAGGASAGLASLPLSPATEEAVLARGKQLFTANCMACHGPQGQGLIGPNLTDTYSIHGPFFADYLLTIWNGVPAKGMIPWKNSLKPDDIYTVGSYVYSLRGTTPPNPKAPEGQPFDPEEVKTEEAARVEAAVQAAEAAAQEAAEAAETDAPEGVPPAEEPAPAAAPET